MGAVIYLNVCSNKVLVSAVIVSVSLFFSPIGGYQVTTGNVNFAYRIRSSRGKTMGALWVMMLFFLQYISFPSQK